MWTLPPASCSISFIEAHKDNAHARTHMQAHTQPKETLLEGKKSATASTHLVFLQG